MSAPEDKPPRRLIVPGSEPEAQEKPRLIIPPGAASVADDELPEYPKLRPLILVPISDGQREILVVQDPLGVVPGQPVLGVESLALLQLFDGATSLTDITAAVMRESKDLRVSNMIREFVSKIDQLMMLDSPRFHRAWREMRDAYHPLEIRQAMFEGRSYPADPEGLTKFLDEHYAAAGGSEAPARAQAPRALLAPHLDPRRAGKVMAAAYRELDPALADREPLRIVVFGTGHTMFGDLFALTRKHFETPLGRVDCDVEFVDAVAGRLGNSAYEAEITHRDEHSIEFQVVYLKHRFGGRRVTIVPILCGGFHALLDSGRTPRELPEFEAMIEAVRDVERERGGHTLYVAGIDLSHIGPRFGDPAVDDRVRTETEAVDRAALEAARRGDADGWFQAIAAQDDATRICGFAPTYAMLRCASPAAEGRLVQYERSDEPDSSFVSVAAMIWES
jgi:MEMO1 family protein